jgi:hypothetical protein
VNITDTVAELKTKLKDAWLRGTAQRIEIGTLLLALRSKAKHGTWGDLLAEVGIPASTAADYMTEASRQIHGIRKFENGDVTVTSVDAETEEIENAVKQAREQLNQSKAEPKPQLQEHNRVKSPVLFCTAAQKEQYQAAKTVDAARVYKIFYAALLQVIGEEEVADEAIAA